MRPYIYVAMPLLLWVGSIGVLSVPVRGNETPDAPKLKPRFELSIPSVKTLYCETMRSNAAPIVDSVRRMLVEAGDSSADGLDTAALEQFASMMAEAPDAAIEAATFAPDLEGHARWALVIDWPVKELYGRMSAMVELGAAKSMFEGVALETHPAGGYVITIGTEPVAYLRSVDEAHAVVASHEDVPVSSLMKADSSEDGRSEAGALLSARLNLTQTEHDSGATFLSSFSAVTAIDYEASVSEGGSWDETVRVLWPPISGMGAKALLGRVKQSFFVPDDALGAIVLSTPMAVAMLDGMAGLGPQILMGSPGQMEIVGEPMAGPIVAHVEADTCFSVLPGTGFLPAPDLLIQVRTKRADDLIEALREETQRINKLFAEREQAEPWSEISVRERPVFWSEPASAPRGVMMPFVMRPVLFTTTETDAKDRERSYLVLGLTTTDPGAFVERWLQQPRTKEFRYLPTKRKINGQVWVQWREVYGLVSPYLNLTLAGAGIDALLPSVESMREKLTEGLITAKIRYSGLTAECSGPLPLGVAFVPSLLIGSLAADDSGSSDLARERLASQRLRLMYHHSKLFKKDIGRWPAEIGELDGYVDFAGHPELLELRVSAKKAWSNLFSGLSETAREDDDEEDEDEGASAIKSDLYVIDWSPDAWSLGFKKDTFEHLERLYVDQSGVIHRRVRVSPPPADTPESESDKPSNGKEEPSTVADDGDDTAEKE